MGYFPCSGYRNVWLRSVTILTVQRHGAEQQEETPRINIPQVSKTQRRRGQPFASGVLLGAIAAAGLVRGLLELQSRKASRQEQNLFSWPAIVRAGRK